jgi:hypothetical protein
MIDNRDPWGNPVGYVRKSDPIEQVKSNLSQLFAYMSKLEEFYNALGTKKENLNMHEEITRLRLLCRDLIKQTKEYLEEIVNTEKKSQLSKNFNEFLEKYEQLSQKALNRERGILQVMESTSRGNKQEAERRSKELKIDLIEIVDDAVIVQRNEGMKKIEQDLKDLLALQEEFKKKLEEDGIRINNVSKNMEDAQENIRTGVDNQDKASKYACCARKQKLVIALIIVAIVVVIVVILVVLLSVLLPRK